MLINFCARPFWNNMPKRQYTIWLDIDGVLADFNSSFKELAKMAVGREMTFEEFGKTYGFSECDKLMKHTTITYWSNLKPLPDYKVLTDYLSENFMDVKILSSTGKSGTVAEMGKKIWLKKHNIPVRTLDVTIVNHSSQKKKYADVNQILIDDFDRNIAEWQAAGGIPIHHKNAADTIKQLQRYATYQSQNL
jgi:hypothetical protein